jgi:hypothetical protein
LVPLQKVVTTGYNLVTSLKQERGTPLGGLFGSVCF